MARKIGQQKGYLFRQGPSWLLRYREYVKADGKNVPIEKCERIGPAIGPERLSRREAERKAKEEILDPLNRRNLRPSSSMLVEDFVTSRFLPQVVARKKAAAQKHYVYLLRAFVLPAMGNRRLCDIQLDDVEALVSSVLHKGLSHQTAMHVRNAVSAIWNLAKWLKLYHDENPALYVDLGEAPMPRKKPTYTWDQAARVLAALPSPVQEMCLLSVATSMNVAEITGLRRKWCNFTGDVKVIDGEVLAPYSIAVRENFYEGQ